MSEEFGQRVRARRQALGQTLKAVSQASGISERYLILAEQGGANLSLSKLRALAAALDLPLSALVSEGPRGELDAVLSERTLAEQAEIAAWVRGRFQRAQRPLLALLGVRGAGKSTVGQALARRLGCGFLELDTRIEQLADLIRAGDHLVVATGGSIVTDVVNYARLRECAVTVWLRALPEEHWDRVIRQGDRRPMQDHPHALGELRALLSLREPLYRQATLTIETSGKTVTEVVSEISAALST